MNQKLECQWSKSFSGTLGAGVLVTGGDEEAGGVGLAGWGRGSMEEG